MKPPKFHVGQAVVCIKGDGWRPEFTAVNRPVKGKVYTIRQVIIDGGDCLLWLKELLNPALKPFLFEPGFLAYRFAPVELLPDEALAELLSETLETIQV